MKKIHKIIDGYLKSIDEEVGEYTKRKMDSVIDKYYDSIKYIEDNENIIKFSEYIFEKKFKKYMIDSDNNESLNNRINLLKVNIPENLTYLDKILSKHDSMIRISSQLNEIFKNFYEKDDYDIIRELIYWYVKKCDTIPKGDDPFILISVTINKPYTVDNFFSAIRYNTLNKIIKQGDELGIDVFTYIKFKYPNATDVLEIDKNLYVPFFGYLYNNYISDKYEDSYNPFKDDKPFFEKELKKFKRENIINKINTLL